MSRRSRRKKSARPPTRKEILADVPETPPILPQVEVDPALVRSPVAGVERPLEPQAPSPLFWLANQVHPASHGLSQASELFDRLSDQMEGSEVDENLQDLLDNTGDLLVACYRNTLAILTMTAPESE